MSFSDGSVEQLGRADMRCEYRYAGWLRSASVVETTTVHTAEVVRYDDPVIITERVAVAAFIAGYTDPTRRSYATDLRIFAGWCHDDGFNLLNVKRPHLETFARWMEQEGRMASTIGRVPSGLNHPTSTTRCLYPLVIHFGCG